MSYLLPILPMMGECDVRAGDRGIYTGADGRKEENEARAELMRDGGYLSAIVPLTCLPKGQA